MSTQLNAWDQYPLSLKIFLISILVAVSGLFIGSPEGIPIGYALSLLSVAVMLLAIPFMLSARKKKAKLTQALDEKKLQRAFYNKCLSYNITAINTPKNLEKAKTIAESMNCPPKVLKNLSAYFEEIKLELQGQKEIVHMEGLEKKRQEEKNLHALFTKYAGYTGKDKRIAMLKEEHASYLQKAADSRKFANSAIQLSQQKEIDWATRGGIVSGLAGGAAGVAAAVDAQIKNAEIRANNASAMKAAGHVVTSLAIDAYQYDNIAKDTASHIAEAKMKIVNKTSKEEVLKKIAFVSPSVSVSPTGAISIKVSASVARPVKILDSADGVIDGTVFAEFYDGKKLVGKAELVIPLWGLNKKSVTLEGICLSGGKEGQHYRVEYKAKHLWEMEA